ncbi:MAG: sigma-70 family RNA polymerase sigma factor [Luteitalea sp.]|nr:sigma-70 family RNA polymerase sigma factor [Luteitalea sp.]
MDDRALARRMLAGDESAFDEFFDGHFPRLYRFVVNRVRDEDAAEDIVQVALVTGLRKLSTWRGEAALFTWFCTLCRHEIGAYYRRQGRPSAVRLIDDVPEIRASLEALAARAADRPDVTLDRHELARLVRLTLDYLPARYGDVLEWKYIEGLAVADIAERLRSTPKAAESLLTRARAAFREGFAALSGWTLTQVVSE